MNIRHIAAYVPIGFACVIMAAACDGGSDNPAESEPAPELVSCDPENGAQELDGSTLTVTFTFDQNVKCPSSGHSRITVDRGAEVSKVTSLKTDVSVELSSLEKGATYTLTIPEGVVSGYRENQEPAEAITYTFSMKDAAKEYSKNPETSLTNANATSAAKKLYQLLLDNYGTNIISGVQSEVGNHKEGQFADEIKSTSGKFPAIQGFDYIFQHWGETDWCSIAEINAEAEDHFSNNGIVAMTWHWNVPSTEGETDPSKYNFYSSKTTFDIKQALTDGTWQHEQILGDIKTVAANLKLLADKDIPVLWRPLHEAVGDYTWGSWFWWGDAGHEYTTQLWKLLYDQLVNVYGLNNLIWVWTFCTSDAGKLADVDKIGQTYPGDEYVDVVGVDLYEGDHSLFSDPEAFAAVNNAVKGRKMVALSECGNLPDIDASFSSDSPWAWFMSWTDTDSSWNSSSIWKSVMNNGKVLTRETMTKL